jgi:hypothetical protein
MHRFATAVLLLALVIATTAATAQTAVAQTPSSTIMRAGTNTQLTQDRAALVKRAALEWIRMDVAFNSKFETTYSLANSNGISLIGILDYDTLDWKTSFSVSDWSEAVAKAQSQYPSIHVWEIWNEPTLTQFQLGYMDGTPEHYLDMLEAAHQVLKSNDPQCTVLGLGGAQLGTGDYNFAQALFSLGGGAFMDAISVHAYPYDINQGQTWDYYKQLWAQELSQYKQLGKPIWVTETGLRSTQNSESDQAAYLLNAYRFFEEQAVSAFIWFMLYDYETSSGTVSWGLLRADSTTKPSYDAYKSCLHILTVTRRS